MPLEYKKLCTWTVTRQTKYSEGIGSLKRYYNTPKKEYVGKFKSSV